MKKIIFLSAYPRLAAWESSIFRNFPFVPSVRTPPVEFGNYYSWYMAPQTRVLSGTQGPTTGMVLRAVVIEIYGVDLSLSVLVNYQQPFCRVASFPISPSPAPWRPCAVPLYEYILCLSWRFTGVPSDGLQLSPGSQTGSRPLKSETSCLLRALSLPQDPGMLPGRRGKEGVAQGKLDRVNERGSSVGTRRG